MKRCLTLGISLCLLVLLSGCCCGQRCGFGRCGGGCSTGYAPACSPCAQPLGGFAPLGGGCSSCGPGGGGGFGGAPVYGAPGYGPGPGAYVEPYGYGSASTADGMPVDTASLPPASGLPTTAYAQPEYGQPVYGQPSYGQPVMGQPSNFGGAPVTALMKPESLATY